IENYTWHGMDKHRQKVPENFWGNRHHALRRQECAENVRVAECIGRRKLGEYASWHAKIQPHSKHVSAASASAHTENELVCCQDLAQHLHHRIDDVTPGFEN